MQILAIETATDRCGAAICQDDAVVIDLLITRPRSHAEFLVPMIEQALRFARLTPGDLDAIAVSMGPGSYTGLRIGVSVAKGLAYATGAQLIGVPSLEALATAMAVHANEGDHVLPAFSARRNEIYASLHCVRVEHSAKSVVPVVEAAAVPLGELGAWLPRIEGRLWLAGDAAERVEEALDSLHHEPRTTNHERSPTLPTASAVGLLGSRLAPATSLASFEPHYLKEFVARKPQRTIFDRLPF